MKWIALIMIIGGLILLVMAYKRDVKSSFNDGTFLIEIGMGISGVGAILAGVVLFLILLFTGPAFSHDKHYAVSSEMKTWFDGLKSGGGAACCSDADGNVVQDADWEFTNGHYRVMIDKNWIEVPDSAIIKEPNLYGPTMVWPIRGYLGVTIRCFILGALM